VTLTVSPGPAFTVTADESNAPGALAYQIAYGDGTTDQNAVPQHCVAGAGSPQSQTWHFTHQYAAPGTYHVSATVSATCTPDRATASLDVHV